MGYETTKEHCKYEFTEDEKKEISQKMALKVTELNQAENDKKAIMSDLKSRIDGLDAEISNAATKINNGYEMRFMDCEKIPDYEMKIWEYRRADNHELIKERRMSSDDLQEKIDFDAKKEDEVVGDADTEDPAESVDTEDRDE